MNLETCLATDVQRLPDLMRAESEAAALTALGAILLRRETEVLTKALQETRADAVTTLNALTQAQVEAEAEALAAADAVRNARVAVAALPDLREALEAGRLAEARVERASVEDELARLERARQEVQAQLEQVTRPRVHKAAQGLSDIDARLAALARPPEPDPATLAVLAEAIMGAHYVAGEGGHHDSH
jgi:chromosome segregation ATPase